MKTPKREHKTNFLEWADEFQGRLSSGQQCAYARWRRKNRVKQLKHTIAVLKYRLKDTEETLRFMQKITRCFIVKPNHWHYLDENGNELTRKQWRVKIKKEEVAKKGVQA